MPQLIQRAPLGLLSLLDSKAGGIAPNALSDLVQPTVELLPLYGLGVRRSVQTSVAAAGVVVGLNQLGGVGQVPSGETWHLLNLTGIVNNVIAAGISWAIGYSNPTGLFHMVGEEKSTPTAIRGLAGGPCDVWLPPGSFVAVYVTRTAAGADLIAYFDYERYSL